MRNNLDDSQSIKHEVHIHIVNDSCDHSLQELKALISADTVSYTHLTLPTILLV